ncbi:MAG: hypothetical protein ACRBDL_01535 [Alphaproteobacteria bacterium]
METGEVLSGGMRTPDLGASFSHHKDFQIDPHSMWAVLCAYHATRSEEQKINKIKEYLYLKEKRDIGQDHDSNRFETLKKQISDEYFVKTDAQNYLSDEYAQTDAGSDYQARVKDLKAYLDNFNDEETAQTTLEQGMAKSIKTAIHRINHCRKMQNSLRGGTVYWDENDSAYTGAQYLVKNFPDIAQTSLGETMGDLNSSISFAKSIQNTSSRINHEYVQSMKNIAHFLDVFNDREEPTLVDLMYYIGEHRDATTYRDSSSDLYAKYETFVVGTTHSMPSQETQRSHIKRVYNAADPDLQQHIYGMRLAEINTKHDLGLNREEVDLFGTATSMISSIMRGYEISNIDDRFKRHIHNSGDHSLRTCITIASIRDANVARFKEQHATGNLSAERLDRQIKLAHESATYLSKIACLHDTGEFLGELLGNNLVDKTEKEESVMRRLRDCTEQHIMDTVFTQELEYRLKNGITQERWKNQSVKGFVKDSLSASSFDFRTPFYDMAFDILERLQTQHDIITQRTVGRINKEGVYEHADTMSKDDARYTMQYAYSKITGHKFHTTDPVDIAEFEQEKYDQKLAQQDYKITNETAIRTGTALPHEPETTRIKDLPHTSTPFDTFMDERDVDFDKSLFKKFVDQTVENYKNLPKEDAISRQRHDEALLHGLCYEIVHYTKKHARTSSFIDDTIVDKATRKSIGQVVALTRSALMDHGIDMQTDMDLKYFELPEKVLGKQRYRVASVNTSTVMGGVFGNKDKPNQLFEPVQNLFKIASSGLKLASDYLLKPALEITKTPVQALMLIDNKHVTEDDFRRLFEITSALEAGGDAGLTLTGLGATTDNSEGFDGKSLALLNPVVTQLLAYPQRRAEAAEKCYGHVLHLHADKIAREYDIEEAIDLIRTRENLKKGQYHRKPNDITASGKLSEHIYGYLTRKYEGEDLTQSDQKHAKKFDQAERYVLREMLTDEIAKISMRAMQETSPVQRKSWQRKIEKMQDAREKIEGDMVFRAGAKYSHEIRFGTITALGVMMAGSDTGVELWNNVTTSTVFGLNLAAAGLTSFMASVGEKIPQLPYYTKLRQTLEDLPHFDRGKDGGLYIVKGATHDLQGTNDESFEETHNKLIKRHHQKPPGIWTQIKDVSIALPVTAVQKLADRNTSGAAFANQSTAQTTDTIGVIGGAFDKANSALNGTAQITGAVASNMFFRRVGVLNMYMLEIRDDLQNGKDPNFDIIKQRVAEKLKDGAYEPLLNAMRNAKDASQDTWLGSLGANAENIVFNDKVSKTTHWILDKQHGIDRKEHELN